MHLLDLMHACLNVDEIIRLIAYELVASEARAAAVSFACYCKSFEDPVLDTLWETQNRLLPLLKSLPEDVWNGGECTVSAQTTCIFSILNCLISKSFKRSPTTEEWARFRKYAQKMRKLEEHDDLGVLSSEVFSVLRLRVINGPIFPNLKTLKLEGTSGKSAPFIPLFLSPRTTTIHITFIYNDLPNAMVVFMVNTFQALCPKLQRISLRLLPIDPTIATAVSRMLLSCNRNALRFVNVDSPLTEEAREVVYNLPDLRELSVFIERDGPSPPVVLPNLIKLFITYGGHNHGGDWLRILRGATFGKLKIVGFDHRSEQIGDFLEAFERVALGTPIQNTLSEFYLHTSCSWNPNYSSLLPFMHLKHLVVYFVCDNGCSSRVDDDIITNLARAMPKLKTLYLGGDPCYEIPIGVTVKGLTILAHHCPDLATLRIHFQVASLSAPPSMDEMVSGWLTDPREDCALEELDVGDIYLREESVLAVALTLVRIFPRLHHIESIDDENWQKVMGALRLSGEIVGCSGEERPLSALRSNFNDIPPANALENGG